MRRSAVKDVCDASSERSVSNRKRDRAIAAVTSVFGLLAALLLGFATPAAAATEDIAPSRTIAGPETGFSNPYGPFGVASTDTGELLVTDAQAHSISIFAADADGDVAPVRKIQGESTEIFRPYAVALLSDGKIAVTHSTQVVGQGQVSVFAADADGDVAPLRTIVGENTKLWFPTGLAVLSDGSFAVVNGEVTDPTDPLGGKVVHVFAPDASGNAAPTRSIVGEQTGLDGALGIAALSDDSLAVANGNEPAVRIFAPDAAGDVAPDRVIKGAGTQVTAPADVTVLSDGSLAVSNVAFTPPGNSVLVFAGDADGDATPTRVITGASTNLNFPTSLAELPNGDLAVVNYFVSSVTVYAGSNASEPAAPTDLSATPGYGEALVYFTPGQDGGSPITNYEYSLDDGNSWVALDPASTTSPVTIPGLTNGVTYQLLLRAVNEVGPGAASDPVPVTPLGAVFLPIQPTRVYDSRSGDGPLSAGAPRLVPTGLPEGTLAVAYNLTAVGMTGSGYLTVSPGGVPVGGTSTLNYAAPGQQWANAFTSGVDAERQIQVTVSGASTDFIVDVVGYYIRQPLLGDVTSKAEVRRNGDESLFVPVKPTRAYDSRDLGAGGPLGNGEPRRVNVTAAGLVPSNALAVAYTLTQTGTVGRGVLTVAPAGTEKPAVSNINWFTDNQTSANSSVVGISNGAVDVWAQSSTGGSSQFVIDILGYYLPFEDAPWAAGYTAIDPQRAYDSREDEPAGPISGGEGFTTSMAVKGVPEQAVGVAFNLTSTGGTDTGYLTTVPGDVLAPPVASTLNWWQPNQTLANGSVVDVPSLDRVVKSQGGEVVKTLGLPVTTFAGGGSTQYVIDVAGYFSFSRVF